MKCLVCGQTIDNYAEICPFCGARIDDNEEDSIYQSFSEYDAFDYTVILTRTSTGEVIEVKEFPSIVGRSSQCDVTVKGNPAIGRKHVEINRLGDRAFVKDLGSKNHTYVNDEIITDIHIIDNRAKLRLANEELIIEVKEQSDF